MSDGDINLAALWVPVMAETSKVKGQLRQAGEEGAREFNAALARTIDPSEFTKKLQASIHNDAVRQAIKDFKQQLDPEEGRGIGGKFAGGIGDGFRDAMPRVSGIMKTGIVAGFTAAFVTEGLHIVTEAMTKVVETVAEGVEKTADEILKIGDAWEQVGRQLAVSTNATGEQFEALQRSADNVIAGGLDVKMDNLGQTMGVLAQRTGLTDAPLEHLTRQVLELGDRFGALDPDMLTRVFAVYKVTDFGSALQSLVNASRNTSTSLRLVVDGARQGGAVLHDLGLSVGQAGAFVAQLTAAGLDLKPVLTGLQMAEKSFTSDKGPYGIIGWADGLKRAFTDINNLETSGTKSDIEAARKLAEQVFGPRNWEAVLNAIKDGTLNVKQLMAAFDGGGEGIDALLARTETLGNKFDDLKNHAYEMFKPFGEVAIAQIGHQLDRLGAYVSANHDQIVHKIVDMGDKFIDMLPKIKEFSSIAIRILGDLAQGLTVAFAPLVNVLGLAGAGMLAVTGNFGQAKDMLAAIGKFDVKTYTGGIASAANDFADTIDRISISTESIKANLTEAADALAGAGSEPSWSALAGSNTSGGATGGTGGSTAAPSFTPPADTPGGGPRSLSSGAFGGVADKSFSQSLSSGDAGGTPASNKALAQQLFAQFWPMSEWPAYEKLEMKEAGFDNHASNPSGAYGMGQFMPYTWGKYGTSGKTDDPQTQLLDQFKYIQGRYGSPSAAWGQYFNHAHGEGSYATGGTVGGGPKGTDTVPAWLTPGEFVINAESTQKFLPLLQKINHFARGGQVRYFDGGGDVGGPDPVSGTYDAIRAALQWLARATNRPVPELGILSHFSSGGMARYLAPGSDDPIAPTDTGGFIPSPATRQPGSFFDDVLGNVGGRKPAAAPKSGKPGSFSGLPNPFTTPSPTAGPPNPGPADGDDSPSPPSDDGGDPYVPNFNLPPLTGNYSIDSRNLQLANQQLEIVRRQESIAKQWAAIATMTDPSKIAAAKQKVQLDQYGLQVDQERMQVDQEKGGKGDKGSTESLTEQFTGGALKGIMGDLGLGGILGGKSPLDWGIVKLATGLAGWGLNMANGWADKQGAAMGLPGFGGGGAGSSGGAGGPGLPGFGGAGGGAALGLLKGLGLPVPKGAGGGGAGVLEQLPGRADMAAAADRVLHNTGNVPVEAMPTTAAGIIASMFPQITDIGGTRPPGPGTAPGTHDIGRTLDVMMPGGSQPESTTPQDLQLGNQIYAYLAQHAPDMGISSMIWQDQGHNFLGGRSGAPGSSWGPQPGHKNHIDVQFMPPGYQPPGDGPLQGPGAIPGPDMDTNAGGAVVNPSAFKPPAPPPIHRASGGPIGYYSGGDYVIDPRTGKQIPGAVWDDQGNKLRKGWERRDHDFTRTTDKAIQSHPSSGGDSGIGDWWNWRNDQGFTTRWPGSDTYNSIVQQAGFKAKGTDTVPAMLTPGEFVVNSSSAKRFAPQLKAMNAKHFASGGQVDAGSVSSAVFGAVGALMSGGNTGVRDIYSSSHIPNSHVALAPSRVGGVPTAGGGATAKGETHSITNDNRIIVHGNTMTDPHQLAAPMQERMNANTYNRGGMQSDGRSGSMPSYTGGGGG